MDTQQYGKPIEVLANYTGGSAKTAISAYDGTIMTVYEHQFADKGVRYSVTYDAGDAWVLG